MKIISYNVNGIRAAFTKDFLGWLKVADPDVICIQESKAGNDQIDIATFRFFGGRVALQLTVHPADAYAGDGTQERSL